MTEKDQNFMRVLLIGGPIFIFLLVLFALTTMLAVPLVLAVVLACLFAIADFAILNWLMRRKTDSAD